MPRPRRALGGLAAVTLPTPDFIRAWRAAKNLAQFCAATGMTKAAARTRRQNINRRLLPYDVQLPKLEGEDWAAMAELARGDAS